MGYWKNWISSVAEDYANIDGMTIEKLAKKYNATEDQVLMAIAIYSDLESWAKGEWKEES